MSIPFTFRYKTFNRSDGGIVAKAAYRLGVTMTEESSGIKWDYSRKHGVSLMECLLPSEEGIIQADPSKLWDSVDKHENRKKQKGYS